jgi:hypothetical protein
MSTVDSFTMALKKDNRFHAHVDHEDSLKTYADILNRSQDELCSQLSTLPFVAHVMSGFYVKKGSPWKELFNVKYVTSKNNIFYKTTSHSFMNASSFG